MESTPSSALPRPPRPRGPVICRWLGAAWRPAVWLSVLFTASRVSVFLFLAGRGTDLGVHAGYAAQVLAGGVPFREFFPEYPPLVLLFTLPPALADPSLRLYFPIFRAMCCAVDCAIWINLLFLNRRRPANSLFYVLATTALGPLLYDRIDLVLGGMLLIAAAALLKRRAALSHLAVGMGIAFKFIPIIWAPVMLAAQWRKGTRRMAASILLLALPTLVSFDAVAMLGGLGFQRLFDYHAARGAQLESTPAAVQMILMRLGEPGVVTFEYGSANLHTRREAAIIRCSNMLLAATILLAAALAARRRMKGAPLALLLCGVLCAALFFSKVLSPQYVLFLLPPLLVLPAARGRIAGAAHWLLMLMLVALTAAIFPWNYARLVALEAPIQAVLFLRNGALALLSAVLFHRAWSRSTAAQ